MPGIETTTVTAKRFLQWRIKEDSDNNLVEESIIENPYLIDFRYEIRFTKSDGNLEPKCILARRTNNSFLHTIKEYPYSISIEAVKDDADAQYMTELILNDVERIKTCMELVKNFNEVQNAINLAIDAGINYDVMKGIRRGIMASLEGLLVRDTYEYDRQKFNPYF